jgi:hypothetical protein
VIKNITRVATGKMTAVKKSLVHDSIAWEAAIVIIETGFGYGERRVLGAADFCLDQVWCLRTAGVWDSMRHPAENNGKCKTRYVYIYCFSLPFSRFMQLFWEPKLLFGSFDN